MNDFNILDIIIGIALIYGAIRGFSRGFIAQLVGLIGIIVALFLSLKFYKLMEAFLLPLDWVSESFISIVSLIVTFGLIFLAINLASKIIQKSVETIGLGFVNRIAGAALGVILFVLISSTLLLIINPILDFMYPEIKENSLLIEPLTTASQEIKNLWTENKDQIRNLRSESYSN